MGRRFAGFVRAAVTDHRAADDYARLSGFGLCIGQRRGDGAYVSPFYPADDMPAVGLEPLGDILAKGDASVALDGDVVVVVEHYELAKAQCACHGCCFGRDSFLEVTIRDDRVGIVVDDRVTGFVVLSGQPTLGQCHADSVAKSLSQRAGGGFNSWSQAVLWVARCFAAPLAEPLQFIHG